MATSMDKAGDQAIMWPFLPTNQNSSYGRIYGINIKRTFIVTLQRSRFLSVYFDVRINEVISSRAGRLVRIGSQSSKQQRPMGVRLSA